MKVGWKMKKHQGMKTAVCAALMSLAMAISAFAATGKISFSDPTVKEGEEVNVTMKIAADDGAQLSSATVTLSYDPGKLEFVAGTDASGGAGTVRLSGASNGAGTPELQYNLKFKTLAAGQSAVNISTQEVYDSAEQPVEISHLGSSTITVNAGETVSADASLSTLEVAPGELTPAFSPDVTSYEVTVGTSVDQLTINALPSDSGASVVLSGNDALSDGDNNVTVRVTAADGQTVRDYAIVVHRVEGGAENTTEGTAEGDSQAETGEGGSAPATETESSGVQLSSKGKTITIMNPGSDVKIPDGFRSSTITVDGQQVQGWVWGADQNPQYCVVYGMNDQGELNFYRYDMAEKTIQRYFEDPLSANSVSNQEYTALQQEYDTLSRNYDMRFFVICILILVGLILLATVIYLFAKLRAAQRPEQKPGQRSRDWRENTGESRTEDYSVYDEELLRHNYDEPETDSEPPIDETQVLRRPQPRRRARSSGDTMPIPTVVSASGKETAEKKNAEKKDPEEQGPEETDLEEKGLEKKAPETEKGGTAISEEKGNETQTDDKDDNEFDTFNI